jgi:hypothetical protein
LSRFRIIALLAALLALAITMAACGGGGSDSSDEDPQQVVEGASLKGVESGNLDLSLHVVSRGDEPGEVDVSLSGPFQQTSKEDLPEAQLEVAVDGEGEGEKIDFEGGATLLSDRAFIAYEGDQYEIDPTTFAFVRSAFEQAQQESGAESADVTACQQAAEGIKFSQFMENLKNEGSVDVEGTTTTKVSGELDAGGAIDALIQLSKDPACASQLEAAGPLPIQELEDAKDEVASALKKTHVDLYVGDDEIVRKVDAELTVEPQDAKGQSVDVEFELTLSGVNEDQSISAPAGAKSIEQLFKKLDINPLELMEAGSSGGLGGLLEGATGSLGSGGGGESSSGSGSAGKQQAYAECLQTAKSAADIQNCSSLLQ